MAKSNIQNPVFVLCFFRRQHDAAVGVMHNLFVGGSGGGEGVPHGGHNNFVQFAGFFWFVFGVNYGREEKG